ncbi:hypothetical protein BGX38DRAFT_587917 [Terfezia claveryi]|nr:hypothetical protein BGX38DRAFT_587917 [Terfezia claveryi]
MLPKFSKTNVTGHRRRKRSEAEEGSGDSDIEVTGRVGRQAKRNKQPYQCHCAESLGSVVALIEELDPNDIDNCQKVLWEVVSGEGEDDKESFTQLCSRHQQHTLAGLGVTTMKFSHQSGLIFLRQMWAHIRDLEAFQVDDRHYQVFRVKCYGGD